MIQCWMKLGRRILVGLFLNFLLSWIWAGITGECQIYTTLTSVWTLGLQFSRQSRISLFVLIFSISRGCASSSPSQLQFLLRRDYQGSKRETQIRFFLSNSKEGGGIEKHGTDPPFWWPTGDC
jgi:hypothetical protein